MVDKNIIFNNTVKKIFDKIKQNSHLHLIGQTQSGWRDTNFEFVCPNHGPFNISGYGIRTSNGILCKHCLIKTEDVKINTFESLSLQARKEYMLNNFPDLDWMDFDESDFYNIDHTIRPACQMHGELITTPRRLLFGDKCKWCDSIKEEDGEYKLDINHDSFINEKLSFYFPDSNIKKVDKFRYLIDNKLTQINELKGNQNYLNHLKEVRNPEQWNSIFFKLIIIDKSSKFQFSIVYYLNLDEQWVNWYKTQILDSDDASVAQTIVTNKIISTWIKLFIGDLFLYEIQWSFWNNAKRVETWYNDYILKNNNKSLILPEAIDNKLSIKFKDVGVNSYWSENKWESTSNSVSMIRESHMKFSDKCPICKKKIISPVVDHEHKKKVKGTGRIRDTICSNCNVFIAKVENNCKRYGTSLEELPEVLKNISEYFTTQQYNIIHYTEKDGKPILSKTLANKIIKWWDVLYPGKKKLKYPKSGNITKDWEDAIKVYEEHLKTPTKPFSKNDYKVLLRDIEIYNALVIHNNEFLPKTKKQKLLEIPEYPKLKIVTPKIQALIDITKLN